MTIWRRIRPQYPHPDEVRMTLGEHLEELRSRLIRAIAALAAGAVLCFCFSTQVMGLLCAPIFSILTRRGYPADLTYLNPMEPFVTDLKVSLIIGFIVSAPYSLVQLWGFVAAGLYPNERRWVHRFAPVSIALFFTGALFLLFVVSPLLLNFLVGYRTELPDLGNWIPQIVKPAVPEPLATDNENEGVEEPGATTTASSEAGSTASSPSSIPAFKEDPPDGWPEGVPWLNRTERQIRIRYGPEVFQISKLGTVVEHPRVKPEIRITEYIVLMLEMAAAFGIGFQVPVVVAFLAVAGIASAAEMAHYRRHVLLVMAVIAAVVTPSPDVVSMLLLLAPMTMLFELGLVAARFIEREAAEAK